MPPPDSRAAVFFEAGPIVSGEARRLAGRLRGEIPLVTGDRAVKKPETAVLTLLTACGAKSDDVVLVGFSGGPDSAALAAAAGTAGSVLGLSVVCVYVDHGIRPVGEREADRLSVRATAESLGLAVDERPIAPGSVESRAAEKGLGIEAAARELRYAAFDAAIVEYRAVFMLLGHTRDDQIETVLMRAIQGSGAEGLKGIPERNGPFLRPFLSLNRRELLEYLSSRGLSYRTDSSNSSNDYLRNRLRNLALPALRTAWPGTDSGLEILAEKMSLLSDLIATEAQEAVPWNYEAGCWSTDAAAFFSARPALRLRSIYGLYDSCVNLGRLPYRFLRPLVKEGASTPDGGGILARGYGLRLESRDGRIFLERDVAVGRKNGYCVYIGGEGSYALGKTLIAELRFRGERSAGGTGDFRADGVVAFRVGSLEIPFLIRSRVEGDAIATGTGRKSLKQLYGEWKVGSEDRHRLPVIEDARGVAAVLGSPFGYPNRFAARVVESGPGSEAKRNDPILEIHFRKEGGIL